LFRFDGSEKWKGEFCRGKTEEVSGGGYTAIGHGMVILQPLEHSYMVMAAMGKIVEMEGRERDIGIEVVMLSVYREGGRKLVP
jgi:hypothetical protein